MYLQTRELFVVYVQHAHCCVYRMGRKSKLLLASQQFVRYKNTY